MKKPLSKALRTFYGVGDFGFSLMASVETYLFVFFLTNVAKFPLPLVAIIGSVTSIVDSIFSPFYGAIISGFKPMKWGRNRSWMLIMPPFVVFFYLFQYSKIGDDFVAAIIVCLGFILSHICWNIAWVGNVSLISVLATVPQERGLLASRRATWTQLAGVFFSYIASPLAIFLGMVVGNDALGYTMLAGIMGLCFLVGYYIIFKLTDGYETVEAATSEDSAVKKPDKVPIGVMLKSIGQNPHLIVLVIADFFRSMTNFILGAGVAYYFTYVAKNMALLPLYLLLGAITGVIGAFLAAPLSKALSNRRTSIYGMFFLAGALIIGNFFSMSVVMFFVFILLARLAVGMLGSSMVALYSDASVFAEWKTGTNASTFVMSLMTISIKVASISRTVVIPIVLAAVGFVATADPATASLALQQGVISVVTLIPGICALVGAILLPLGYKLTNEKLVQYQKEIDERKKVLA